MNRAIVSFYTRVGTDAANRTVNDVHAFGHAELEGHHDFIQWLFPLDVPSAAISQSPILEPSEITEFRASPALRERLLMSLDLMLDFYGFERKQIAISRSAAWDTRSVEWVTCRNHNFLRITRILKSLSILGLRDHAEALLEALDRVYADYPVVGDVTYQFWKSALLDPDIPSERNT